jgi:uncharacterized protein (UPF0332 family)
VPTTQEHRFRAESNLRFAQSFDLDSTPFIDWVPTAYFYAALHWIDALLYHQDSIDPEDHEGRRELVKQKWYLRGIRDEYRNLKDYSEDARYRLLTFTRRKIEDKVIPLYEAIERHALDLLDPRK